MAKKKSSGTGMHWLYFAGGAALGVGGALLAARAMAPAPAAATLMPAHPMGLLPHVRSVTGHAPSAAKLARKRRRRKAQRMKHKARKHAKHPHKGVTGRVGMIGKGVTGLGAVTGMGPNRGLIIFKGVGR